MALPKLTSQGQIALICALFASLSVWILAAAHWCDLLSTQSIGGLFGQLAIVLSVAYGVRPRNANSIEPDATEASDDSSK